MDNKYDVIIVGAGPAGLFATLELIKNDKKVLLIDKGRSIEARICPMKTGAPECVHCNPCNVVCGWGGAGAFSDGKLTLTPEFGGNLEEYCGREKLLSLIDEADRVYLEHGASTTLFKPSGDLAKKVITKALQAGLDIIPATIRHMGTDRSKQILGAIYQTIKDSCEVRTNTMAEKVLLKSDGSVAGVMLANGEEIYADRVLLAPGREGAAWMEKTVKDLGLQ
ncbi:MAG: FAD-binding protein, partial [Synergistaceae bacterium]